jgi:hypothetical protein
LKQQQEHNFSNLMTQSLEQTLSILLILIFNDVKAKRGITDYVVMSVMSQITLPILLTANQFRADIYIKPARSVSTLLD